MAIWQYCPSDRIVACDVVDKITQAMDGNEIRKRDGNHLLNDRAVDAILSQQNHHCLYCRSALSVHTNRSPEFADWKYNISELLYDGLLLTCGSCGWWVNVRFGDYVSSGSRFWHSKSLEICQSTLLDLDLSDISISTEDVRAYLSLKFDNRFSMSPRLFEETVASVFRNVGYDTEVTQYSRDGGVDIILSRGSSERIGVQVKRYRSKILVSQIREFIGALVVSGYTHGVFVTTSSFTKGAVQSVSAAQSKGLYIDLVGDSEFLSMLNIGKTKVYESYSDWNSRNCGMGYRQVGTVNFYNYSA